MTTNATQISTETRQRYQISLFAEALRLGFNVRFKYHDDDVEVIAEPRAIIPGANEDGLTNILLHCHVPNKGYRNYKAGSLRGLRLESRS